MQRAGVQGGRPLAIGNRGRLGGWLRRLATEAAARSSELECARKPAARAGAARLIQQLPPQGGGATRRTQPRSSRRVAPSPRDGSGGEKQRAGVREEAGSASGRCSFDSAASPARRGSHPPGSSRGRLGGWLRRLATEAAERSSELECARRPAARPGAARWIQQLPPQGGGATRRAQPRSSRRVAPSRRDGSGGEKQRAGVREAAGSASGRCSLIQQLPPQGGGATRRAAAAGFARGRDAVLRMVRGGAKRVSTAWLRLLTACFGFQTHAFGFQTGSLEPKLGVQLQKLDLSELNWEFGGQTLNLPLKLWI